jgi:hypothetical protein
VVLLGIFLGLALLIGFAYRGWSVLLLAPAAALFPAAGKTGVGQDVASRRQGAAVAELNLPVLRSTCSGSAQPLIARRTDVA